MEGDFTTFIANERERINGEREKLIAQQRELEEKLGGLNRELSAVDAYEAAKAGTLLAPVVSNGRRGSRGRKPQGTGTRIRGSKRDALLKVIRAHKGVTRGEILQEMGLKGNKSGEMSVSNALTALIKANQIHRENGKYLVNAA